MLVIEKESKRNGPFIRGRVYTASARAAMIHILSVKQAQSSKGILLPSYIGLSKIEGSGVFDPVLKTKIPYEFYELNHQLSIDLSLLEEKLKTGNFQLFFLIHYFGCPQSDPKEIVQLCHRYNVLVIEDCAHSLFGSIGGELLGNFGDYSIFSIHKSTSSKDGGFYLDNRGDLPNLHSNSDLSISKKSLEIYSNTDIVSASNRRLRNYLHVSKWVSETDGLKLFFNEIPEGSVPLNCPIIVNNDKRRILYERLVKKNILPTALYHTLIPQIRKDDFPISYEVSDSILNLPTHQDITDEMYPLYESTFKKVVEEVFSYD